MTRKITCINFWPGFSPKDIIATSHLLEHHQAELTNNPRECDLVISSVFGNVPLANYSCSKLLVSYESYPRWINYGVYPTAGVDYLVACNTKTVFPILDPETKFFYSSAATLRYDIEGEHKGRIYDRSWCENLTKDKFCSFVFGNGNSRDEGVVFRDNLFRELSRYKKVDAGGAHLNNMGGKRVPTDLPSYLAWTGGYKFCICCENSAADGYFTEKLLHPYIAGTVPIYWGHNSVTTLFNEASMVRFPNVINEVVKKVIELDTDPYKYKEMLCASPLLTPDVPMCLSNDALRTFLNTMMEEISQA